MSATTLRILIALILIAHGLVHVSLTTVPTPQPGAIRTPFWPGWWRDAVDSQWLASRIGLAPQTVRALGALLWLVTLAGFTLAGLGLAGLPGVNAIWQPAALVGAAASLLLLVFYWHPWLVMGAAIDLAVLAALWQHWPVSLFRA
jgi:hypothetical protein